MSSTHALGFPNHSFFALFWLDILDLFPKRKGGREGPTASMVQFYNFCLHLFIRFTNLELRDLQKACPARPPKSSLTIRFNHDKNELIEGGVSWVIVLRSRVNPTPVRETYTLVAPSLSFVDLREEACIQQKI